MGTRIVGGFYNLDDYNQYVVDTKDLRIMGAPSKKKNAYVQRLAKRESLDLPPIRA